MNLKNNDKCLQVLSSNPVKFTFHFWQGLPKIIYF